MKPTAKQIAEIAVDSAFELLEANGMTDQAGDLPELLCEAAKKRGETITAIITTPTGDSGPLKEKIRAELAKKYGKPIRVLERKDEALLGGAVVEYGDERVDVSVRYALDKAKTELSTTHDS